MKSTLALILVIFICTTAHAQVIKNGKITISVLNQQNAPLENTTVELLRSKDSGLVKTAITDKSGTALLERLAPGTYIIKASMVNYTPRYSSAVIVTAEQNDIKVPAISLEQKSGELKEVAVTTRKPFIQKLTDRIVVNVENSIVSTGSSAMDVLERSPGVNIDQNDAISLRGKQGVIIMVDGKPSPLSGADLANYLRGLPSNALERIDIITNPSAKYDASGNSGIIDIRMKKDQRLGANGTFTAGYGQGVYPKANTGATFNYRNKKINVFGNYNYAYRKNLNHLFLDRNFYNNGIYNGGDLKDNYTTIPVNFHTARFGADYFASKKTIIGFVVTSNFSHVNQDNDNNSIVFDAQKTRTYTFQTKALSNSHSKNMIANINYKHTFSPGRELTADADYGIFNSDALSTTATKYYNLTGGTQQPHYILKGDQDGRLTLKTAKIDYVNPLKKEAKFEIGAKTSYVSSDNDVKFFDASSGTPQDDVNKTNRFFYEEYNNAGYVNFSKQFKKYNFQFGLRGEHTKLSTHQVKGNVFYDSSYFQLFPSAYFNYNIKEDQTVGLSVSRRIDRPGYSQLNPFLFLIDVTTYSTGNPGLRPQLTWSYELSYTLKSLNFTLGYSHTKDNINIVVTRFKNVFPNIPTPENVTVLLPVNLASSDYFGLTVAAPVKISKWWNMINNANLYYNKYNGELGGTVLNNGKPSFDMRTNNTFTLKKGWTTELSGSFSSGGQYGFMVTDPQWSLSAGVQKTIFKNKGTLRFNISDIFWTNLPKAVITYNNYIEKWHAQRESRVANISFTYRFGKNTVAAERRRQTSSQEEQRRIN